jgi:hypothetical protein
MELRARIPTLRRAAMMAALVALAAPATAGAAPTAHAAKAKKTRTVKTPVITAVAPMDVAVGEWLVLRGRHFVRGAKKNTVVFKRAGARAVFAKAEYGTAKLLKIQVPAALQAVMTPKDGNPSPTRFRVRVLARKFGRAFTATRLSPVVSPPRPAKTDTPTSASPDGDCDGDGARNAADADDDNDNLTDTVELSLGTDPCVVDSDGDGTADTWEFDCDRDGLLNRDEADDDDDLLSDTLEVAIKTDPCNKDTDGDGVEDGYEYQSAKDLNDDEHQQPNKDLPYPGKRPYPNALFPDADVDYDGDTLTLKEEYQLWVYSTTVANTDARTLTPLSYSDGEQYSRSLRVGNGSDAGRRRPTLNRENYDKHEQFLSWANDAGYGRAVVMNVPWWTPLYSLWGERSELPLLDVNRDGTVSDSEKYYYDENGDGWLSDDERDEDADGLSNYDETHGRLTTEYWKSCYGGERVYYVPYTGTDLADPDTDGDGVRDGADDQDNDDVPNVMELSRRAASGFDDTDGRDCAPRKEPSLPTKPGRAGDYGRVNPFNPCLPNLRARTCPSHYNDKTGAPFDDSPDWYSFN